MVKRRGSLKSPRNTSSLSVKPQEKDKKILLSEEILKFSLEYYGMTLFQRSCHLTPEVVDALYKEDERKQLQVAPGGLGWTGGKKPSSPKGLSSVGAGCPGKWFAQSPSLGGFKRRADAARGDTV